MALVTGAAHGQGRATALALAKAGAKVAALDVAEAAGLSRLRDGLVERTWIRSRPSVKAAGSEALTFAGDVRDDAAISRAVDETVKRFGRIDILFNNAGICAYGLAHELTEDAWDAMIDINLKGPWLVARRVIPVMIRPEVRRHHQQLVGRRAARDGPAQPLRRVQVGAHRADQVVGDRAGAARHPGGLAPPHRRQHPDERRARRARGAHARRRSPSALPATCSRCRGSSPRTWRRRCSTSPPTARGS